MIRRQPARGAASIEGRAAPGALDVAHMLHAQWFLVLGALLALMAYLRHVIERLPVSTAMIYLAVGIALGPSFAGWLAFDPLQQRELLETAAEVAVLLSLFTAGIKLRVPLGRAAWRLPLQLAKLSMLATVVLVTLFGQLVLGLPTGLALLVAAVLAPTDPVLAADVQLRDPQDRDRLRLALTGEAAMNDGTAFPFVFLGLGLLGLHELGVGGSGWLVRDLLWGTLGGLGIGFVVGHLAAMAARQLRRRREDAVRHDEYLLLSVVALSYGAAVALQALGFLAVFAAALAVQRVDRADVGPAPDGSHTAVAPGMLHLNEQFERLIEVALVLLVGTMVSAGHWSWTGFALAAFLILVARPLAIPLGTWRTATLRPQRRLMGWFGIRGVGSVYYAAFAAGEGLADATARALLDAVFTVIATSVVVHGVSATPLMSRYERHRARLPRRR